MRSVRVSWIEVAAVAATGVKEVRGFGTVLDFIVHGGDVCAVVHHETKHQLAVKLFEGLRVEGSPLPA